MKFIFSVLFVCLFFFSNSFAQEPPVKLPEFSFVDSLDKPFSNANLDKDKKTLIVFFDATCGHCKESMKVFNKRTEELKDISIILISMDVMKSINMFLNEFGPDIRKKENVHILRDTAYSFVPLFYPAKYPSIYLYSKEGKLLIYANNDEKIQEVFKLIARKED